MTGSSQESFSLMKGSSFTHWILLTIISVILMTRLRAGEGLSESMEEEEKSPSEIGLDRSEVVAEIGMGEGRKVVQAT
jgi:hypothetical protein